MNGETGAYCLHDILRVVDDDQRAELASFRWC